MSIQLLCHTLSLVQYVHGSCIYWWLCWWCDSPLQTSEHKFNVLSGLFFVLVIYYGAREFTSYYSNNFSIHSLLLCSPAQSTHTQTCCYLLPTSKYRSYLFVCLFVYFHRSIELSINRLGFGCSLSDHHQVNAVLLLLLFVSWLFFICIWINHHLWWMAIKVNHVCQL